VDRSTALTYLTNEFAELAADAGFSSGQTTTAYNIALDMSLRQLGYAEIDLATTDVGQSNILNYLSLMTYYALKRFARLLALRVDTTVGMQLQAKRSQAAIQVKALLDDAEAEVIAKGFQVGPVPAFALGRMNLDFMEPSYGEY